MNYQLRIVDANTLAIKASCSCDTLHGVTAQGGTFSGDEYLFRLCQPLDTATFRCDRCGDMVVIGPDVDGQISIVTKPSLVELFQAIMTP
jgi:hypothetical protein